MVIRDIEQIIEGWAPKEIAWERDNIGLQIGNPHRKVKKILVTLDVTQEVFEEARKKKIDLVISHHPLIFHPIKAIDMDEKVGRLVRALIQHDIALYAAHTNLDFIKNGVSFTIAERIGLKNIDFLLKNYRIEKKVIVFVPGDYVNKVRKAMSGAGAGVIGKYEECSFGASGIGTFKPSRGTKPFFGKIDQFEKVQEIKLEMIVPQWKLNNVLAAMKSAHPYEKIAYDVINLGNISHDYGVGAIGILENKMHTKKFLKHLSRILKIPVLRFSGKTNNIIERVAVCGGGGSDLIQVAQKQGADVLVTGDISYHSFAETDHNMMIVDAGHYETEYPIVEKLVRYLRDAIGKYNSKIEIHASRLSTNTVQYFIS